jgi:hypothetical protein
MTQLQPKSTANWCIARAIGSSLRREAGGKTGTRARLTSPAIAVIDKHVEVEKSRTYRLLEPPALGDAGHSTDHKWAVQ